MYTIYQICFVIPIIQVSEREKNKCQGDKRQSSGTYMYHLYVVVTGGGVSL